MGPPARSRRSTCDSTASPRSMVILVSGIGLLVFAYAHWYFPARGEALGRLIGLLTLFSGAMLGLVLADNLLVLYGCWELTSITSFFLIGNKHASARARAAALQALLITGLGALAMLVGLHPDRPAGRDLPPLRDPGRPPGRHRDRRGAGARAARRGDQVGPVPVPLLAAGRDGRAHAGQRLPALGDDGEGRRLPGRSLHAGLRRGRTVATGGRDDRRGVDAARWACEPCASTTSSCSSRSARSASSASCSCCSASAPPSR